MECPSCGLLNHKSAKRCDCGYDFASKKIERSYLPVETGYKIRAQKRSRILFYTTLLLALMGLIFIGVGQSFDYSFLVTLGIVCFIGGIATRLFWWASKVS